jgi:hypothetical protein
MSEYGCSDPPAALNQRKVRTVMNQKQSDGAGRTENCVGQEDLRLGRRLATSRKNAIKVRLF